jgi:hypothetical protein
MGVYQGCAFLHDRKNLCGQCCAAHGRPTPF